MSIMFVASPSVQATLLQQQTGTKKTHSDGAQSSLMMPFAQRSTAPLHHRSDVERDHFEDPSSQPSLATCLPSQGRRLPGTPYPHLEWSPHRRTAPSWQTLTPCLDPLLSPHNTYHLLQGLTRAPPTMLHYHNICESGRYMIT